MCYRTGVVVGGKEIGEQFAKFSRGRIVFVGLGDQYVLDRAIMYVDVEQQTMLL